MNALKNNKPCLSEINLLDRTQNLLIGGEWVAALSGETFEDVGDMHTELASLSAVCCLHGLRMLVAAKAANHNGYWH